MWPSLWLTILAAWSCFYPHVASAQSGKKLYAKEGDQVVLKPDVSPTSSITKIVWRDGSNIAAQWDDEEAVVTYYRLFKGNAALNTSNGEMTITGLTRDYNAVYTPDINDLKGTPIDLRVLSPVPVPTVTKDCKKVTTCTLTCEGNITGAEEVTYKWKSDDKELESSAKTLDIQEEKDKGVNEFSCELSNPISKEISKPLANPFKKSTAMNVNMGLTVLITLLAAVIVLALVHRCKAGDWFFNKDSMPYEADFWRKEQKQRRNAASSAESNGIKDHQEQGHGDDESQVI